MDEIDNSNQLIECPFCKKKMKGKSLAGHAKRLHGNKNNSILLAHNGKAIPKSDKPEVLEGSRNYTIDESGFLVPGSTIEGYKFKKRSKVSGAKKASNKSKQQTNSTIQARSLEQTNIFNEIRLHKPKIPGAIKKRLRPYPDQIVACPICSTQYRYISLFDHVTRFHKELNAKMVLAHFNRDYENSRK